MQVVMPSRVTVFACTALLLACACGVLATASGEQQHALLSRLHKAKRTARAHQRLHASASASVTATPTDSKPVDVLGTDWSTVDFTTRTTAPVTVTVKAGAVLYHSSDVHVNFKSNPHNYQGFWMTPDVAQSIAGGVNKAKEHHGPVFVHPYKPARDLKLLALPACAKAGIAYLNSVVATDTTGLQPWPHTLMANPSQTNGLHPWVGKACAVLQQHGIDGWRSPWDQDEIMLCIAHQKELVPQQVYGCMFELLGPNVATRTYWNPVNSTPKRFDAQVHAFAPDVCGTDQDLFSYESHVRWATDLGHNTQVPWTAQWWKAVESTAVQREVVNPTKYVKDLVARYTGQLIDAESYAWFCGPAPSQ